MTTMRRIYAPAVISAPGVQEWIFVPHEDNTETARAVLARPQDYGFAVQQAACLWLLDHGDWLDRERARILLEVLKAEAELAMLMHETRKQQNNAFWGAVKWTGIAIAAALAAWWLLHIGQKAYGQYQYDAAQFAARHAVND
jgi:hypothetical protein